MSGGSFNYLYRKAAGVVLEAPELDEMADELEGLGFLAEEPAKRTRALVDLRAQVTREVEALADLWQAVEWWRSNDYGQDQVFVAIGQYRERQTQLVGLERRRERKSA